MFIDHLVLHLAKALFGYSEERARQQHDQQVAKNRHRRRFAHFDVPPIEVIEERHGQRFGELVAMLVELDPAELHTRKSAKGHDPKHVDMMGRRYRLMAWTLIHRLAGPGAERNVRALVERELSLWFGRDELNDDSQDPEALVARLSYWRSRWDYLEKAEG